MKDWGTGLGTRVQDQVTEVLDVGPEAPDDGREAYDQATKIQDVGPRAQHQAPEFSSRLQMFSMSVLQFSIILF